MKLKIRKNIRIIVIIILAILFILMGYYIYSNISKYKVESYNEEVYSYSILGQSSYKVNLMDNPIYDKEYLEEDKIYLNAFVESIDVDLKYDLVISQKTNLKGTYEIKGKLYGLTKEGENNIILWEKIIPLKNIEIIESNDGSIHIEDNIVIDLEPYSQLMQEITELSKISGYTFLDVIMVVDISGNIGENQFDENSEIGVNIPINSSIFQITKMNVDKNETIEKEIQIETKNTIKDIIIYIVFEVMLILGIIYMVFFTIIIPEKTMIEKINMKIFKQYGSRIVGINSEIEENNIILVNSMEDLVKCADELEKPILYKYDKNYNNIDKFYVCTDNHTYVYMNLLLVSDELVD